MSIQALEWARRQMVGDAHAKSLLRAVADYAGEDGACWPSLRRLSEDCEFSEDTVRRKLRLLEDGGWLVRIKVWMDENGRRNTDGRGRETSHEIRLLLLRAPPEQSSVMPPDDVDSDAYEGLQPARVAACEASTPARGGVAVVLPPNEPSLNQEKNPPNPPTGGGRVIDEELEVDIEAFAKAYPAPLTDLPKLRALFAAMTQAERQRVIRAAVGYAAHIRDCERRGKPRAVKDAHRWVSGGQYEGYVVAGERAEAAAKITNVPVDSEAGKAWAVVHKIAHAPRPFAGAAGYALPEPPSPRLLAFAHAPPESEWIFIGSEERNHVRAWDDLIRELLKGRARPPLVREGPSGQRGFLVPWPWPPRVDGSLCTGPPALATAEDIAEFAEHG